MIRATSKTYGTNNNNKQLLMIEEKQYSRMNKVKISKCWKSLIAISNSNLHKKQKVTKNRFFDTMTKRITLVRHKWSDAKDHQCK